LFIMLKLRRGLKVFADQKVNSILRNLNSEED